MPLTAAKARQILEDGKAHGQALTARQRGLFALIAAGKKPTHLQEKDEHNG